MADEWILSVLFFFFLAFVILLLRDTVFMVSIEKVDLLLCVCYR